MSFWHTPRPQEPERLVDSAHSVKAPKQAKKRAPAKKKGR